MRYLQMQQNHNVSDGMSQAWHSFMLPLPFLPQNGMEDAGIKKLACSNLI